MSAPTLFPYSFTPRNAEPANLAGFMRRAVAERPGLAQAADWELDPEKMPEHVTFQNFGMVVPINLEHRIEEAGMELCAKLAAFCVRFLEKVALHHTNDHAGEVPSAEQIMADVEAMAEKAVDIPTHEVWKYSLALKNPVVHAAVTNALNHRWNRPGPEAEQYALFFPSEFEMIGPDLLAGRRRNNGAVARHRAPAGARAGKAGLPPNSPGGMDKPALQTPL